MIVELIAHTQIYNPAHSPNGGRWEWQTGDQPPADADDIAEFAGRNCYQSWSKPNPATAANKDYLDHILRVKHESVLEHASATFYLEGVSRSLLTELERHRHLSFSVLSQRYVDHAQAAFVENAVVTRAAFRAGILLGKLATDILDAYIRIYDDLRSQGYTVKKAREAARWVLPNAVETKIVVTGNMRAWRYVINARNHEGADVEIQELAIRVLEELKEIAPNTFQDM